MTNFEAGPRTVLAKLLDGDGRQSAPHVLADCPAPFHARIARHRVAAPSFKIDARGIGECRACGFRCGPMEYLVIVRGLGIDAAREELARTGASQQWIAKTARQYGKNVAVLLAFAVRLRQQPERRHILTADVLPWFRRELQRDGLDFEADGMDLADRVRAYGLRPRVLRIRKRSDPPPHTARGYARADVLQAARIAGLPTA